MFVFAIVLFVLMYVMMVILPKWRPWVALAVAVIYVVSGILPLSSLASSIDWNVILMLFGTMLLLDSFIESKMPNLMADALLGISKNVMWLAVWMSVFAGLISAFIDNVATLLMIAPVALAVCRKLKISPVPMIICIAVSSNLQGAATLVGDTTSIMLAGYAGMDFLDFFWMNGRPGIFFAVELGALATIPIIMFLFRKETEPVEKDARTSVTDYIPTIMMAAHIVLLIAASFIPDKPSVTNGLICVGCGVINIILEMIRTKDTRIAVSGIKAVDFETIIMLASLFVVIGGISEVGLIRIIAQFIAGLGKNSIFVLYSAVVWGSVIISAFIDNIPYVATMLPILAGVTAAVGIEPYLMYFGLLTGATLGGNITPVGASANITAVGMLKKEGYTVRFRDFFRIGIPFTLAATLVGYIFIWIFW